MRLSCDVRVHGVPSVRMIYIQGDNAGVELLNNLARKIEKACGDKAEVNVYALSVEVKIPACEELLISAIKDIVAAA